MTSSATKIYRFFTDILGMRLIKKTVNQDDIETYHLYFTDDTGAPGTDMTFFDFPNQPKGKKEQIRSLVLLSVCQVTQL